VEEMTGGESTIMCANFWLSDDNKRRISSDPISSAGFGGIGPDVNNFKLGSLSYVWITLSKSLDSPERQLVKPRMFERLKFECRRGRRKSQSIISTSAPVW